MSLIQGSKSVQVDLDLVLKAIDDEPEFPGHMPDSMWEQIRDDRWIAERSLKLAIRLAKDHIKARIVDRTK